MPRNIRGERLYSNPVWTGWASSPYSDLEFGEGNHRINKTTEGEDMAEQGDSSLQSLDDFKDLEPSGGHAKVQTRAKVKQQRWGSDDQAENLLADIGSLLGNEAEAEEERIKAEIQEREDEKRRSKENAENRRRQEGEMKLAAEKQRVEEQDRRRKEEKERIAREEAIARGDIDPEAEAREAAEAERKARADAELKVEKDQALTDAQRLIQEQKQALQRLTEVNMQPVQPIQIEQPKRSPLPMILALLVIIGVGVGAVLMLQNKNAVTQQDLKAPEGVLLTSAKGAINYTTGANYPANPLAYTTKATTKQEVGSVFASKMAEAGTSTTDEPKPKAKKRKRRRKKKASSSSSGGRLRGLKRNKKFAK